MYADGALFATASVSTIKSAGINFARGLSNTQFIEGFPSSNQGARLEWREAKQSFVITELYNNIQSLDGVYDLVRATVQQTNNRLLDSEQPSFEATGTLVISGRNWSYTMTLYAVGATPSTVSDRGTLTDWGYYFEDNFGNKIVIADRGLTLIGSRLYYQAQLGYVNEIEIWKKRL